VGLVFKFEIFLLAKQLFEAGPSLSGSVICYAYNFTNQGEMKYTKAIKFPICANFNKYKNSPTFYIFARVN
jgi:hypothetical protein